MGQNDILERSSIGRSGNLGALYDFRSDKFQGDNIFKSSLDGDEIYNTEQGNTTVELMISDSLKDKFHHLDIQAELSVSILSGLVKVSGSAKFLDEKTSTSKSSSMSLIYKVTTVTEEIYLRQLKSKVDLDALQSSEATHVLTGVDWGAVCTVTAQYTYNNDQEKKKIEGSLKAELNKIKGIVDIKGQASVDYNDQELNNEETFKFYSKCDVGNSGNDLPVTFQEAVQQAKKLPQLVKDTNNEKGVPLRFTFTPLSTVRKWFKLESAANIAFKEVQEDSLARVVSFVQQATNTRLKIEEMITTLTEEKECIPEAELTYFRKLFQSYTQQEAEFRQKLQTVLHKVRSDKAGPTDLENTIVEFEKGSYSTTYVDNQLEEKQSLLHKIARVKQLQKNGIKYFGRQEIIDLMAANEVYILYAKDLKEADGSINFLRRIKCGLNNDTDVEVYLKDCSVLPREIQKGSNKIHHYKGGSRISEDFQAEKDHDAEMCLVQMMKPESFATPPFDLLDFVLRCPGSFSVSQVSGIEGCSAGEKAWHCYKCKSMLQFCKTKTGANSEKIYCLNCKFKCLPINAKFRCKETEHGFDFQFYDNEVDLATEVSKITSFGQVNILILGETGVGKSTWINSFANYIAHDNLRDAIAAGKDNAIVAIPSKFTYTKNGKTHEIKIGNDDSNEVHDVGVSNTQGAKTYRFKLGDTTVNIIDTPGIGDTRGSKQDDKNMENILGHLTYYKELHGIVVLLKPNNARLGIIFKHCIQQLLSHLHRSAAQNISFGFTNTRSTFYEPGETLPSLRKLLEEKNMGIEAVEANMFCFDNEAFRLLACIHNGIHFTDDVIDIYSKSWEKACTETNRMMKHILEDTRPHTVQDTTSINDARRIILGLSRPLQEFAATIKKTERKAEHHLNEIKVLGAEATSFREKLNFEGTTLEQHNLPKPRTVCTHENCRKLVAVGKDKITQPVYVQHCHEECNLGGSVSPEVIGDARLMNCWAITDNNHCRHSQCGHHYSVHMHRTYDLIQVKKQFESDDVKVQLNAKLSKKQEVENEKKRLEKLVGELKSEGKTIQGVAAGFAAFLKTHSIIPFNDAMGEYIDVQIKEEKEKDDLDGKKSQRIEEWKNYKQQYEERRKILTTQMDNAKDTDYGRAQSSQQIKDLMENAFKLKHYGKDIKEVYDRITKAKEEAYYSQAPTQHLRGTSKIKKPKEKPLYKRAEDWAADKWAKLTKSAA